MSLPPREVIITGASGFIGTRLVELCFQEKVGNPIAVVGSYENLARAKRFPLATHKWDMLTEKFPTHTLSKGGIVVHLAYTKKFREPLNFKANYEGTKNLLHACRERGVAQFIYVSSTAVYDEMPDGQLILEDTPPVLRRESYAYDKSKIEEYLIETAGKSNLPFCILRPAIIYGPFGPAWTIRVYSWIKNNKLKKYKEFKGKCNLVYLDNVAKFIVNCFNNVKTQGRNYNLIDPGDISWSEYFAKYETLLMKQLSYGNYYSYFLKCLVKAKIVDFLKSIFWLKPTFFRKIKNKYVSPAALGFIMSTGPDPATLKFFDLSHRYDLERNFDVLPRDSWVDYTRGWQAVEKHFAEYCY